MIAAFISYFVNWESALIYGFLIHEQLLVRLCRRNLLAVICLPNMGPDLRPDLALKVKQQNLVFYLVQRYCIFGRQRYSF